MTLYLALLWPAGAAQLMVPSAPYPTIQSAVDAAGTDDKVLVASAIYDEHVTIDHSLTLQAMSTVYWVATASATGIGPTEVLKITGAGTHLTITGPFSISGTDNTDLPDHRVIDVENATVHFVGLTITDGYAERGAGLQLIDATTSLDDCLIDDNFAAVDGGGIYVRGGTLSFSGLSTSLNRNGTDGDGGALHVAGSSVATLYDTTFENNWAAGNGGQIASKDSELFLINGRISGGWSNINGGGIYAVDNTTNLDGTDFSGNNAIGGGGHIASEFGTLTIVGGQFDNGWADYGGALNVSGTTLGLDGITLKNNNAKYGGAAYLSSPMDGVGSLTAADNTLRRNGALYQGGGFYLAMPAEITGGLFATNEANLGGAIYLAGPQLLASDISFDHNSARTAGGAISSAISSLGVFGCSFTTNSAPTAGALDLRNTPVVASDNTLCFNSADSGGGGAVRVANGGSRSANVWQRNLFVNNTALTKGGAIWVDDADLRLVNNSLITNDASEGGAVEVLNTVRFEFVNNLVSNSEGYGVYAASPLPAPLAYSAWWLNIPQDVGGTPLPTLGVGTVSGNPSIVSTSSCVRNTYTLSQNSPLLDAGDPSLQDMNGTRSDIGALGGLSLDANALRDVDGDGAIAAVDCNDADITVFPGASELCDAVDHDCDGSTEANAVDQKDWFLDFDGDGVGGDVLTRACSAPANYTDQSGDCDDTDSAIHPGAAEVCNGIDDDCANGVDQGAVDALSWYEDDDGDTFGGVLTSVACSGNPTWVSNDDDCDDTTASTFPGASEDCNGVDDDCNNLIDDGLAEHTWYPDRDTDGYGDPNETEQGCAPPDDSWVRNSSDCDDDAVHTYPGAEDAWYDGVDANCDQADDYDQDGDGYASDAYGGADCADLDPSIHPGADDISDDEIDQDCDGTLSRSWIAGGGSGCGCATGRAPGSSLMLPLLGLALLRRRRTT